MRTAVCELLGIEIPIIQAPMGGAVGPQVVAAVSSAGGPGTIPLWGKDIDTVRDRIREIKSLSSKPFAANLNLGFPHEERLEVCLQMRVPVISFFWGSSPEIGRSCQGWWSCRHANSGDGKRSTSRRWERC